MVNLVVIYLSVILLAPVLFAVVHLILAFLLVTFDVCMDFIVVLLDICSSSDLDVCWGPGSNRYACDCSDVGTCNAVVCVMYVSVIVGLCWWL